MKKLHLTLILTLLAFNILTAQTSFKKIISIYDEQSPVYIIEGNSGNFLISALVSINNENFNDIIKINKYGDIVKDTVILERKSFDSIKFYNNNYYLIGDIWDTTIFHNNPPYNMKIILTKLDTNLNLVKEDTIAFSTDKWISNQDFIIDSDSNIVIYGTSRWYIDSIWDTSTASFLYKISLNGDSLSYKEPPVFEICDIKENTNNNEYYSLKSGSSSNFIKMDKNLTILQDTMISNLYYNLKMSSVNNDTLMIVGTASTGELKAIIVDTINYHGLNSKTFAGNTCRKSFAYKNDNYFVLGMYSNIFRIYKLNLDLSVVWDKAVDDANNNYASTIIEATNDGGCIIMNDRSSSGEIYLVKIATDGTIQWENEVPINANITIFPNPGNNFINIKSDKEYLRFEMFDISGKQVLSKTQQSKTINTQNLNSGIYIYKLIDKNNNVLKTGKWIKNN